MLVFYGLLGGCIPSWSLVSADFSPAFLYPSECVWMVPGTVDCD